MDAAVLARLRERLAPPEPPRASLPVDASAVLVPLLDAPGGVRLLFIRRTAEVRRHPGQVAFPGGGMDPGDATPLEAALRETREEVGIEPGHVQVLGHLTDFTTHYGRLVCAYVGLVDPAAPPPRVADPREVAELLVVPVAHLLDPAAYEGRTFPGSPRGEAVLHYWRLPQATVWGITGELVARFLHAGWGWRPTGTPRVVTDPKEVPP